MSEVLAPVAELVDVARTGPAQRAEFALPQLIVDAGLRRWGSSSSSSPGGSSTGGLRAAYGRAVGQFLAWCEARGAGWRSRSLRDEMRGQGVSAPPSQPVVLLSVTS